MGCLARLGCLAVLLGCGVAAYLTRDRWMDKLPGRTAQTETTRTTPGSDTLKAGDGTRAAGTGGADADGWTPLTEAGAKRTRDALQKLSARGGPLYVTLDGADVASYVFLQVVKQMPASADSFAARVDDDQVRMRARMKTSDLGSSVIGVIGGLLGDRERVEMAGTLRVVGTGLAEFRVRQVRVHDVGIPAALITRMIKPMAKAPRPAALNEDGLPIAIPSYIGDVRVSNGRITLYKTVK